MSRRPVSIVIIAIALGAFASARSIVDGNKVEPSEGELNSGGFAIPSTIHMARPDIDCVIHSHTIAGCAVSMQKAGLLPLNQHALQVIGDIAYHDYEGTGRSQDERQRFLADFGDKHIMVLRNHGLFVIGRTIAEAFISTYRMERACAMQLAFQQSGDRKSTRLNSSHEVPSRMPSSA